MSRTSDLYHDLDAPDFYWKMEEGEQRQKAALAAVKWLVLNHWEDHPDDHRTGCLNNILHVVAKTLVEDRGWRSRQAVDALVLEAVRTGGEIERKSYIANMKANEARQAAKAAKVVKP